MKKILSKPQFFFFLLAVLFIIIGLIKKSSAIDVAIFGALVDLSVWSTCLFSALFFVLIGVNYASLTITEKHPKKGLTITHIILQVLALLPFTYVILSAGSSRSYEQVSQMNLILIFAFVIFILATIIHLINFVASILKRKE